MLDNEERSGSHSSFAGSNTSDPRQASSAGRSASTTESSDMTNTERVLDNNRVEGQARRDIDADIQEPLDISVVLNATQHYQELDDLEHETAKLCKIHQVITSSSNISLTNCLAILLGCRDALENLERAKFCSEDFNIFVEDPRRDVADTVNISIIEIDNLIAVLQFQGADGQGAHTSIGRLGAKLRLAEEKPLVSICKVLSFGLVSFSVSHACRFDMDIFNEVIGTFQVGKERTLSLRNLACLQDFIGGPVWVLGRNESAQELKLSINVEEFDLLWGPVWSVGPVVEVRGGYIIAVDPSETCAQGEMECHWQKDITKVDTAPCFSLTSQMLIGSETSMFDINQSCVTDIQTHQQSIAQDL